MLGLGFSAVALWLVIRQLEWEQVKSTLVSADLRFVLAAALSFPCRALVITIRWRALLGLFGALPPLGLLLRATGVGYLANNVLPFRTGELIRGGVAVQGGASVAATASTLVLEKVLDLWALVGCVGVFGDAYVPAGSPLVQPLRAVGLVAAVTFVAYLVAALLFGQERLTSWAARRGISAATLTGKLVQATTASCRLLHRPRPALTAVWTTAVNWSLEACALVITAWALGLPLAPCGALFVVAVVGLGLTVPSSPGGIGVSQLLVLETLKAQGVEVNTAAALAFLSWAVGYLSVGLTGVGCLLAIATGRRAPGLPPTDAEPAQ